MDSEARFLRKCYFLLPGHCLEEFPTYLTDAEARDLLACWSATWHPAFLVEQNAPSQWLRAGMDVPQTLDSIVLVPQVSLRYLSDSFRTAIEANHSTLIESMPLCSRSRNTLIEKALACWPEAAARAGNMDDDLVKDFFALAFAYLQVQIMTRQLRYSSNFKQVPFDESLLKAAEATAAGNRTLAEEHLTVCFDLLMEERNAYYPARPHLVDLVLLAPTTLGNSLDRQLESTHALSLMLTGQLAERLLATNPQAAKRINEKLDHQQLCLVGGSRLELPDPLVSSETVLRQLAENRVVMQKLFQTSPRIYARRRSGLMPTLPATLEQFEFLGAIHATLDGGQLPKGSSVHIRWNGMDGSSLLAHCEPPWDANDSSHLLRLAMNLGQQIDSIHTATGIFAHWPNRTCEAFQDLVRIQKYAPILGHFVHAEEFFESLYDPGYGEQLEISDYQSPFLQQAIAQEQLDPVSRYLDYWRSHHLLISARALVTQLAVLEHWQNSASSNAAARFAFQESLAEISEFESQLDVAVESEKSQHLQGVLEKSLGLHAAILKRTGRLPVSDAQVAIINTLNFRRRNLVDFKGHAPPQTGGASIIFSDHLMTASGPRASSQTHAVVELPGNCELGEMPLSNNLSKSSGLESEPSIAGELSLKNEFFELQIDSATGGIKTLVSYADRNNLLSQQLAARIPDSRAASASSESFSSSRYTRMIADEIKTHLHSRISASIRSTGRLVDDNQVVATFHQTVTVTRGLPAFELEIEFFPASKFSKNPHHYLCNRMAWKDESSEVFANLHEGRQAVGAEWILATGYVQVQQGDQSVALLTGGLPYHRRVSRRMLDTILMVANETRTRFHLGIGVNLPYPLLSAYSRMTPMVLCAANSSPASRGESWFIHVDRKNILVSFWEPEFDPESLRLEAVQIRFRETEGRAGELAVTLREAFTSASLVSFDGRFLRSLKSDPATPNRVSYPFNPFENFQFRIRL
jgi:alpha-mannosidase